MVRRDKKCVFKGHNKNESGFIKIVGKNIKKELRERIKSSDDFHSGQHICSDCFKIVTGSEHRTRIRRPFPVPSVSDSKNAAPVIPCGNFHEEGTSGTNKRKRKSPKRVEGEEGVFDLRKELSDIGIELPKKPKGGYVAFVTSIRESVKAKYPEATFGDLTHLTADAWNKLPQEEKKKYLDKAKADSQSYLKELDEMSIKYGIDLRGIGKFRRRRKKKRIVKKKFSSNSTMFVRKSLTSAEKQRKLVQSGSEVTAEPPKGATKRPTKRATKRKSLNLNMSMASEAKKSRPCQQSEDGKEVVKEKKQVGRPVDLRTKFKLQAIADSEFGPEKPPHWRQCCIPGCESWSQFFTMRSFPLNNSERELWRKKIREAFNASDSDLTINKYGIQRLSYVCELHFLKELPHPGRKAKISYDTAPSIFKKEDVLLNVVLGTVGLPGKYSLNEGGGEGGEDCEVQIERFDSGSSCSNSSGGDENETLLSRCQLESSSFSKAESEEVRPQDSCWTKPGKNLDPMPAFPFLKVESNLLETIIKEFYSDSEDVISSHPTKNMSNIAPEDNSFQDMKVDPASHVDSNGEDPLGNNIVFDLFCDTGHDSALEEDLNIQFPVNRAKAVDDLSPEDVHPEDVSPEGIHPEDVSPEDIHPEDVSPEDIHPEDVNPEDIHPEDVHPEDLCPEDVSPEDLCPEDVSPESEPSSPEPAETDVDMYIRDDENRHKCFSRKKKILLKKARDLHALTGAEVHLRITSKDNQKTYFYTSGKRMEEGTENIIQITENYPSGIVAPSRSALGAGGSTEEDPTLSAVVEVRKVEKQLQTKNAGPVRLAKALLPVVKLTRLEWN